eukprot:m.372121 g.372121  ORF g.372121 m.372121 type:complete len:326 (-) comp62240_c0_seq1:471-1448(-)
MDIPGFIGGQSVRDMLRTQPSISAASSSQMLPQGFPPSTFSQQLTFLQQMSPLLQQQQQLQLQLFQQTQQQQQRAQLEQQRLFQQLHQQQAMQFGMPSPIDPMTQLSRQPVMLAGAPSTSLSLSAAQSLAPIALYQPTKPAAVHLERDRNRRSSKAFRQRKKAHLEALKKHTQDLHVQCSELLDEMLQQDGITLNTLRKEVPRFQSLFEECKVNQEFSEPFTLTSFSTSELAKQTKFPSTSRLRSMHYRREKQREHMCWLERQRQLFSLRVALVQYCEIKLPQITPTPTIEWVPPRNAVASHTQVSASKVDCASDSTVHEPSLSE